jgi:hypothetical protein
MFTKARHRPISCAKRTQSIIANLFPLRYNLILYSYLHLRLLSGYSLHVNCKASQIQRIGVNQTTRVWSGGFCLSRTNTQATTNDTHLLRQSTKSLWSFCDQLNNTVGATIETRKVCESIPTTDVADFGSDILNLKHHPTLQMLEPRKASRYQIEKHQDIR